LEKELTKIFQDFKSKVDELHDLLDDYHTLSDDLKFEMPPFIDCRMQQFCEQLLVIQNHLRSIETNLYCLFARVMKGEKTK